MSYDEALAERVREALKEHDNIHERKMFGGLAFMLGGNMCCGVLESDLVLRLDNDLAAEALMNEHARAMDFTGKPIKSMVYVSPDGTKTEKSLRDWVALAVEFAKTLPPK